MTITNTNIVKEIEMKDFNKSYHDFVFIDYEISDPKKYLKLLQEYKQTFITSMNHEIKTTFSHIPL